MKKFLFLLPLLFFSCAPTLVTFNDGDWVDVIDNLQDNKSQLYLKANEWLIKSFNSAESVIEYQDKEDGVIMGKYVMYGRSGDHDTRVYAIIDIRVKDGKARIEVRPQKSWKYGPGTIYGYSKQDAIEEIKNLSFSFQDAMMSKSVAF